MSSQAFFWLNVGGGLILVILFLIGRRGLTAPSKLNLRRGGFGAEPQSQAVTQSPNSFFAEGPQGEKDLTVFFMYNGHSFEAYEVLGAPAGASIDTAEKFLHQALARNGSDRPFLEAAIAAIRDSRQN